MAPHRIHWNWLSLWAFLTIFAVLEVDKHGFLNGSPIEAAALTSAAVGLFVAPDLTFLIGAGQPPRTGSGEETIVSNCGRVTVMYSGSDVTPVTTEPNAGSLSM